MLRWPGEPSQPVQSVLDWHRGGSTALIFLVASGHDSRLHGVPVDGLEATNGRPESLCFYRDSFPGSVLRGRQVGELIINHGKEQAPHSPVHTYQLQPGNHSVRITRESSRSHLSVHVILGPLGLSSVSGFVSHRTLFVAGLGNAWAGCSTRHNLALAGSSAQLKPTLHSPDRSAHS